MNWKLALASGILWSLGAVFWALSGSLVLTVMYALLAAMYLAVAAAKLWDRR